MAFLQSWKTILCFVAGLFCLALAVLLGLWFGRPGALLKPVLENVNIKGLALSMSDLGRIKEGDKEARQQLMDRLVALLKDDVKESGLQVEVEKEDIVLEKNLPNKDIATGKVHVTASNVIVHGRILNSTNLTTSVEDTNLGLEALLQTQVDAEIKVEADISVETKSFIAWVQTFPMEVSTRGQVDILVILTVSDIELAVEEGDLVVNYNTKIDLKGRMFNWNVDSVEMDNCSLKLGRQSIGSVCPLVKSVLKKGLQAYLDTWTQFEVPRLLEKLDDKLKSKLGVKRSIEVIDF